MGTLGFRIITPDDNIVGRWRRAFVREGWRVAAAVPCPEEPAMSGAEVDLIEIGPDLCSTPEDLKRILDEREPVSAIVFGDQAKSSNKLIADLLEAGADDFVYKNIDERILVAKLKAHIRRLMPAISERSARATSSCGAIEVDRLRHSVKVQAAKGRRTEILNLTQRELDILTFLIDHEKQVVSRETMLERIWGEGAVDVYSECVDKHIESLRRKLGLCGKKIRTVYGAGYMFNGESPVK